MQVLVSEIPVQMECQTSSAIENSYKRYSQDLREISLKIHEYRELSYQEHMSAKLLSGFLQKEGFNVERGIAGKETAFVATYVQGRGPVVSFNAVHESSSGTDVRNMMLSQKLDMPVDIT
jgi:aminobenzoyl-glutamate utilization protein B